MKSSESKILYYYDSAPITKKDVISALMKLGVKKGDTVIVSIKNGELSIETQKGKIKSSIRVKSKSITE